MRRTHIAEIRRVVNELDCGLHRVEADEHGIWFERKSVLDQVMATREIEDAVPADGLLKGRCVISLTIAGNAQGADVDPICGARKRNDGGR